MRPPARTEIPVYRMLTLDAATIGTRAEAVVRMIARADGVRADVIDGLSAVGGGAAPATALATKLIAIAVADRSASAVLTSLRRGDPPIIARIEDERVLLDLRTVREDEDAIIAGALMALGS
jgi:L-seryl-tRNA(Ser) seleniumtransferase